MSKSIFLGLCLLLCTYVSYGQQYRATGVYNAGPETVAVPAPQIESGTPSSRSNGSRLELRTNILYDAFLTPTLGVEWRINRDLGIKLDGSRSHWGDRHGKVQKIWLLNPEVRWYLLDSKLFYVGAGANFGEYNIYGGMIGNMFPDGTGYQGKVWGAGVTVGYKLLLNCFLSLDFNIGLGYTHFDDDSFVIINRMRVFKEKNRSTDFWGPTQAGISLVWSIGGNQ